MIVSVPSRRTTGCRIIAERENEATVQISAEAESPGQEKLVCSKHSYCFMVWKPPHFRSSSSLPLM